MCSQRLDAALQKCVGELRAVLREEGLDELAAKRWDDLEGPATDVGDTLTRKLLQMLLAEQAEEMDQSPEACSHCGTRFVPKPDQARRLQTRRGHVHWKQPVRRCTKCRRDFFPSGQGIGL